jgi:hypothetical protein
LLLSCSPPEWNVCVRVWTLWAFTAALQTSRPFPSRVTCNACMRVMAQGVQLKFLLDDFTNL